MARKEIRQFMKALVEEYRRGDQKKAEFCQEKDVSIAKLNYWIGQFNKSAGRKSGTFVEVSEAVGRAGVLVRIPNGIEIECPDGLPADLLHQLLKYAGK